MAETLRGVDEIFDDAGPTDSTEAFTRLWSITEELMAKIRHRFDVTLDPSVADLDSYRGAEKYPAGHLAAYSGPEMDWLVHSWIGNPELGFTNMHVTAWLGPQVDVPHLGIAWGTLPDLWCYIDYNPRSDLMLDLDSLNKYYEPFNDQLLELREDPGLSTFVSKALYVRQALSDTAICYTCPGVSFDEARIQQFSDLAHDRVDRWLEFVDAAEPVPADRRAQLAADDEARRRNIAELDPANVMGVRFFGEELTERLVRSLWGGDRQLPRPT